MKLFVTMWNTLENKYSTLAKIAEFKLKDDEDSERLAKASRGIPRIADDRIPEITRRFPKTSEYYYTTPNFWKGHLDDRSTFV